MKRTSTRSTSHQLWVAIFCLLSISYFSSRQAIAQTNHAGKNLHIRAGFDNILFNDINFSPLNYDASGFAGSLAYTSLSQRGLIFHAGFDFSSSTLQAAPGPAFDALRYTTHLEAGLLKRVSKPGQRVQWYVGGQAHAYLDFVSFDELESISFYGLHSFDVRAQMAYKLSGRHTLSHSLSIPVFGLLVRPPYTGWDKFVVENEDNILKILTTGKWTSLNDFQAVRLQTTYAYNLSAKWDLIAGYTFDFHRTARLKKVTTVSNQLTLGLRLNF